MNPLRIFTALMGFLAALLAISRGERVFVWVAFGLLGASLAIRMIQKAHVRRDASERDATGSDH
jgi:hypothetical protein